MGRGAPGGSGGSGVWRVRVVRGWSRPRGGAAYVTASRPFE
ncbi:hypothetical protein STRIP9103_05706 [Streptomyces ipomoeae 91-03]|uniref:Uncharacterized protein n=1 Tax=Streptomyces ipomoeae 91-03 TaxID=698759 RepID=L1KX30_9ACTN|nr:hypothetical protein STRIP9103_05706 [Streptomyces ipomoeae 91-03]